MSTAIAHKVKPKKSKSKGSRSGTFVVAKKAKKKNQKKGEKKGEGLFIAKKNKKQEENKKVVAKEQFYGEFKVIKTPSKPSEDKAFQQTIKHVENTKNIQKVHPKAENKLTEVKESAVLSTVEQDKKNAQGEHFESIKSTSEEAKKKKFTPQTFKNLLASNLKELEKSLPKDQDEAKTFKKDKPLNSIKESVGNSVSEEKDKLAGPLVKDAEETKLPKSKLLTETAKPLVKEETGEQPKPINQKASVPKTKHKTEISMEKESQSIDNYMEENEVTETQLAKSNEPKFLEALDSKTEAQVEAKKAPKKYRNIENKTLGAARSKAGIDGKNGLHGMFKSKLGNFGGVEKKQTTTDKADKEAQKSVNILFEEKYKTTKSEVVKKLKGITTDVDGFFKDGREVDKAKKVFEKNVEKKLSDVYGYTGGLWEAIGVADYSKEVAAVFKSEKTKFIKVLDSIFDKIAVIISNGLNEAMTIIDKGRKDTEKLYSGLSKKQKELAKEAFEDFTDRYSDLEDTVASKEEELASNLADKYKENVDSLKETFDTIKEKVSATWITSAFNFINGVIETIKKLRQLVSDLLAEIKAFLPIIMDDPIGFAANLFKGIGQGIDAFKANIQKHLFGGFIQWLTGAMGPMGITIPKDIFSLKGIFNLTMQVLGLTWDYMRKKAVKLLGEPVVKAMEFGLEMFKIIKEKGIDGIWEYIKDKFADLKETVIEAIKEMLITQVLEAGVKWMISLLIPGAGFIKAIMAIKDIIVFFVESALMLIPALIESIRAMASGSVTGVAKAIEKGLGLLVPLVINLFAKLIGLGGLAKKVQKIIKRIRKRIDKAINKLIKKAKKAFKGLVKKGKAKVKGAVSKLINWWTHKKKFKDKNNQEHTLFFEGKGKNSKLMMRSVKKQVLKHINEHKKDPKTRAKAIEAEVAYNQFITIKSLALKGGKTPKEDDTIAKNLISIVNLVSQKLRELPGDFTPTDYPTAADVDFNSDNNKPTNVTMSYLTDAVQYGSPPSGGSGVTGWNEVKNTLGLTQGQDDGWIQFHLINDNLGGEGNPNNLVPTPNSINKAYQKFENKTHTLIFNTSSRGANNNAPNQKNVVWMHVKVKYYKKELNVFAKQVQAKSGIYHYKPKEGKNNLKQKWIKDSKAIFTATLDVPNPRLMVLGVNLAQSGQQHIKSFFDKKGITYSTPLIDEIVNNRPYSNKVDFAKKLTNSLKNRKIDNNIRRANETQVRIKIEKILRYFDNKLNSK